MDIKSAVYQIPPNDFLCRFASLVSLLLLREKLFLFSGISACLFPPQGQQQLLYYERYHIGLCIDLNSANLISNQMPQRTLIIPIVFYIFCFNSIFGYFRSSCGTVDSPQQKEELFNLVNISGGLQRQRSLGAFQIISSQPTLHTRLELLCCCAAAAQHKGPGPFKSITPQQLCVWETQLVWSRWALAWIAHGSADKCEQVCINILPRAL